MRRPRRIVKGISSQMLRVIVYIAVHCKMKRAKLTPKAKLAPISRGPIWPIKVRFGLFEPKRVGQVSFRPLQNLNWPLWILLWNFFSIWPFQEPSRIDQFGPNEVQFLKKKENIKIIFFFRPYFVPYTIPYKVFKFSTVPLVTEHRVTQRINRWLFLETWAWAACDGISRT